MMTEPVLTGHAADRITERLDELADLAAMMREPAEPSARGQTKPDKEARKA